MDMNITFAHGMKVVADYKGFSISTDQPAHQGGAGSAPAPFDYFLVSIGTCAGFFVKQFLTQRKLDTAGLRLALRTIRDPETHLLSRIDIQVDLPDDFPPKYERAIVRAVDQCTVKKVLLTPPEFRVICARAEQAPA